MIEGDVLIACTTSGAVYLLEQVVSVNPGDLETAIKALKASGAEARLIGLPCAACRATVSTDRVMQRSLVCTYRPLQGPLYVPRTLHGA